MPPKIKFTDMMQLKKQLSMAIQVALIEFLNQPVVYTELSGSIQHTELSPDGNALDIHFRVQVKPKTTKPSEE